MSIRGSGQELFIGKQSIRIRDWMYNTKTINYDNLGKVEYCFRTMTEGGYIDFYDAYGHFDRFSFPRKSNEAIQRAVNYLEENFPELELEKHDVESDPFYTKNIFISIFSIFCIWPVGLILCWCTGKRTLKERIMFTLIILIFQASVYIFWYWYTQMQINASMNAVNDYLNQINSIFQ